VKKVTGKTLRDFDQENIFEPLGMKSTVIFNDYSQVVPHRAIGYSFDADEKRFGVEMSNFEQTGDGSVQTSVEDLLRWDENFYTAKLGGADLIRDMQIVGKLNNGRPHTYAAGLEISNYRGQPVVSHGGAWAGYRAELMRFPQQHTSVAVLCNAAQSAPTKRAYAVADVVLANVLTPPANRTEREQRSNPISTEVLESYVGVYRSEKRGLQRVEFNDGKLSLASYGAELIPQSSSVFTTTVAAGTISFHNKQMVIDFGGEPESYELIPTSAPKDLTRFVGDYYSTELDAVWQLRIRDGQLVAQVKHSDSPAMTLRPISEDTFMLEDGSLHFENQTSPKRAYLTISRIRNVEFVKN